MGLNQKYIIISRLVRFSFYICTTSMINSDDCFVILLCCSNAGQVRKSLSIKPNANNNGYFVSLSKIIFFSISFSPLLLLILHNAPCVLSDCCTFFGSCCQQPVKHQRLLQCSCHNCWVCCNEDSLQCMPFICLVFHKFANYIIASMDWWISTCNN